MAVARPKGETQWIRLHVRPLGEPQACRGFVVNISDVTDMRHRLQQLADATSREQREIGRALHDSVCQELTAVALLSKALEEDLSDRGAPELKDAAQIADLCGEMATRLRGLTRTLLPVQLEPEGLADALKDLVTSAETLHGLKCHLEIGEFQPVSDATTANHLYQIAREAIHNVVKHAGATSVRIRIWTDDDRLVLMVSDDGIGIRVDDTEHGGVGLQLMRHRAEVLEGTLRVLPGTPRGTLVSCTIPKQRRGNP